MSEQRALSVSEAMGAARRALETVVVRVIGEVSEFNDKPGYKAAYFTVCDEGASMPCMMWRDAYLASGVELRCGVLVELSGQFSAYAPKGRMQFQVRSLSLAGEGVLRMQVAALARRLEAEGMMAPERKRPIPRFPRRIALVTSPRGKAVHDVIRTLRRRYPLAELLVAGVGVEGAAAPGELVTGLAAAAASHPDVVLLVRGGGSYEDLMPFNDERVARAIIACPVPVVTGIGHEPDTSIADMVADMRASTPTAAAEAVAPSIDELSRALDRTRVSLGRALLHRTQAARQRVNVLSGLPIFRDPISVLGPAWQALDAASIGLRRAIPGRLERDAARIEFARERLLHAGPAVTDAAGTRLAVGAARLDALSPLSVLGRGYAVCFGPDGNAVVTSPEQVTPGDHVSVRVAAGTIGCVVESTQALEE
ncbi:MAG: exodeoxyribonuclease VII large subunit [Coriobacteriia bacterium]